MTDYPELVRTKKELGLLQKLYGLYNAVIDGVNGYYDILWNEVDIEKINNELIDFQNRYFFSRLLFPGNLLSSMYLVCTLISFRQLLLTTKQLLFNAFFG